MVVAQATSTVNCQNAPAGYCDRDEQAAPTSGAFDALLEVMRSIHTTVAGIGVAGDISESQMFEEQSGSNKRGGATANDQKPSTTSEQLSMEAADRTGVRARLAAREESISRGDRSHDHVMNRASDRQGEGRPSAGQLWKQDGETKSPLAKSPLSKSLSTESTSSIAGKAAGQGESGDATSNRSGDAGWASPGSGSSVASGSSPADGSSVRGASGVSGVASAGDVSVQGRQGESVARQVAQLLNAAKGTEVESARAVVSTAGGEGGRSAASGGKDAQRGEVLRQSQADQTTQHGRLSGGAERSAFDRLVSSIRLQPGAHQTTARMRLDPPELGRMSVNVRLAGDGLQIEVRAQTRRARDVLVQRVAELRDALDQHGIRIDRFVVSSEVDGETRLSSEGNAGSPDEGKDMNDGAGRSGGDSRRSQQDAASIREVRNLAGDARADDAGSPTSPEHPEVLSVGAEARLDVKA